MSDALAWLQDRAFARASGDWAGSWLPAEAQRLLSCASEGIV
jgi:hypothetical protein